LIRIRIMTQRHLASAILALALAGGIALPAQAQTCPTDFTSLSSQIITAAVSEKLGTTVDEVIEHVGSLEAAVTLYDSELVRMQALQTSLQDAPAGERRELDDAVVLVAAIADALHCRNGQ
jgi:hypothetical protein